MAQQVCATVANKTCLLFAPFWAYSMHNVRVQHAQILTMGHYHDEVVRLLELFFYLGPVDILPMIDYVIGSAIFTMFPFYHFLS